MIDGGSETHSGGKGVAVFVAHFFPPFNIVASQRALRMARVLLQHFDTVHVLTLPIDDLPREQIDESFGRDELANPRLHVTRLRPLLPGYGIVANVRTSHRVMGATLTRLLCSPGADWMPPLTRALDAIGNHSRIRLVLATGGPFIPFLTATSFARRAGAPCVLDYRDLWSTNPRAPYPRLARALIGRTVERWVNRRTRLITTVSEGCRRSLESKSAASRVTTLMNTPDESYRAWFREQGSADRPKQFDPGRLNIVLAGTVYPECTCAPLIRALLRLPPESRARVRLHYFGGSGDLVAKEFASAALVNNLIMHGFVTKQAAAAAVHAGDVLLSLVYDASSGSDSSEVLGLMTTKVFDYFLSGKPIINVSPPEADVCVFARQLGHAEFHTFAGHETAGLAEFLARAIVDLDGVRRRCAQVELPDFGREFAGVLRDVGI